MALTLDEQVALLMHGTQFGDEQTGRVMARELRERLAEGRPLRVYLGIDPTTPQLHLGHTVPLRKLAQFQRLGHECTLLIGGFTAAIGDPTERDRTRPQLTPEQVQANLVTFARQAFKLLDQQRTSLRNNTEWLADLRFGDIVRLASQFTVAQFLERDNFARRYAAGEPIHLHEFFYALMQGYDAVALQADVQVGGTDQTFNLLAGRRLQEASGQRPQVVLTTPLLPGTDGQQKMSKSLGNALAVESTAEELYGGIMSIPDSAMPIYFELLSRRSPAELEQSMAALARGEQHPRDLKMALAREVTAGLHGEQAAAQAETEFVRVFQQRHQPADMPSHALLQPSSLVDLLVELGLAESRSAARRLVEQGGVRLDDERLSDPQLLLGPEAGQRVLRVGKRRFVRLLPGEPAA